eukprot:gene34240-42223_t
MRKIQSKSSNTSPNPPPPQNGSNRNVLPPPPPNTDSPGGSISKLFPSVGGRSDENGGHSYLSGLRVVSVDEYDEGSEDDSDGEISKLERETAEERRKMSQNGSQQNGSQSAGLNGDQRRSSYADTVPQLDASNVRTNLFDELYYVNHSQDEFDKSTASASTSTERQLLAETD